MKSLLFILTLSSSFPLFSMSLFSSCEEVRGSFDIGSGSTKAYVARVDRCKNIILEPLLVEQTPIGFKDSLDSDGSFNPLVIDEARIKFQALAASMKALGAKRISAVATAAFREAKNGESAAKTIAESSGVSIKIITQMEEARLGVISARAAMTTDEMSEKPVGVWDIGGGSMQMTYFNAEGKAEVYEGDLASVSFKNRVITDLLKKNIRTTPSPNPLGPLFSKAVLISQKYSEEKTPESLKHSAPKSRWLGIGGVWWFSVRNQIPKDEVIRDTDLEKALQKRSKLKDSEIGGSYASTEITNLALVLGYMKGLKIQEVRPVEASLVQGLVLEEF